jgi:predicted membrane protein
METNETSSRDQLRKEQRDKFRNQMEDRFGSKSGRILGGIFLLVVGGVLLAHEVGADIPHWVFTWPMIPLAIGLFIGAKMNFRPDGWLIPVAIGGAFLLNEISPELHLMPFVWPTIIIVIGLFMIFRPRKHQRGEFWNEVASTESGELLEIVSVFSGNKKMIITKNFKGGEAVSVFGGTELNLIQADINGTATLELTQVFGGAKLIVPANWKIDALQVVSVFGALEDKRQMTNEPADETKVLKIIGTSVFGGIEIKSY